MSVFISYSHANKDFVDRLAAQLVTRTVAVWIDRWELRAGDSLVGRIQDAIQKAASIVIVLSKASVESEWCKKELTVGLFRELEERRIVVIPALIEECTVPLFLREKKYADFRLSFDAGLADVLEGIAFVSNLNQGRTISPEFHTDWSIDWRSRDDSYHMTITMVDHAVQHPFSTLTTVVIALNDRAVRRQHQYESAGLGWWGRKMILEMLCDHFSKATLDVLLPDEHVQANTLVFDDAKNGYRHDVAIECRRLGEDTGKTILLHVGNQLLKVCQTAEDRTRVPTKEELAKIVGLLD